MDRFYIWEDDEQHGPYTEGQIERMLEDRIITFSHACENVDTGESMPLDELFEVVPEGELKNQSPAKEEAEDNDEWEYEDEEEEEADADPVAWEEEQWEETEEEEYEEDDDGSPPPNAIIFQGHPTFLRYTGLLVLAALGVAFGLWMGPKSLWFFIGGFGLAVMIAIGIVIDRSTRVFLVTPKRVEVIWGLFAKNSNEVRIEDIRTINIRKEGVAGWLGVGTVEFSSTGDKIDVAFTDLWAARSIKVLVRELQDEME